jgi:hypothetical protein
MANPMDTINIRTVSIVGAGYSSTPILKPEAAFIVWLIAACARDTRFRE